MHHAEHLQVVIVGSTADLRSAPGRASPTFAHIAAATAWALLYCSGGLILGRSGAALGDLQRTRRVERGLACVCSSPDHDGESGGLSG
jgi:hypothetical protein